MIGDVNTATIDIGDIQALGEGSDINQSSAILHETVEQYNIQIKDQNHMKAHLKASGAERLVTGSYVHPIDRFTNNGEMHVPILSPSGSEIQKTVVIYINSVGNVIGIKR